MLPNEYDMVTLGANWTRFFVHNNRMEALHAEGYEGSELIIHKTDDGAIWFETADGQATLCINENNHLVLTPKAQNTFTRFKIHYISYPPSYPGYYSRLESCDVPGQFLAVGPEVPSGTGLKPGARLVILSTEESEDTVIATTDFGRIRMPKEFAVVLCYEYGVTDGWPTDKSQAENLANKAVEAKFNAVLVNYEDWKVGLCQEKGLRFIVNMLDPKNKVIGDDGKPTRATRDLTSHLENNQQAWGYHLVSDIIDEASIALYLNQARVMHALDSNHPTLIGFSLNSRSHTGIRGVRHYKRSKGDTVLLFQFYFWKHAYDPDLNFQFLNTFREVASREDSYFYRWIAVDSGRPEIPNRTRYVLYTSLAFGMKGVLWWNCNEVINSSDGTQGRYWTDVKGLNTELTALGQEIIKLRSVDVYSTETSKTPKGVKKAKSSIPANLKPILTSMNAQINVQVKSGEVLLGRFQNWEENTGNKMQDVYLIVNHWADHGQKGVNLHFSPPPDKPGSQLTIEKFTPLSGNWEKCDGAACEFDLVAGGGQLVRATLS